MTGVQTCALPICFPVTIPIGFLEKTLQSGFLSKQIRHFDVHEGLSQFLHRSCQIVCEVSLLSLDCLLDEKFVQVEVNLRGVDSVYVRCFLIDIWDQFLEHIHTELVIVFLLCVLHSLINRMDLLSSGFPHFSKAGFVQGSCYE